MFATIMVLLPSQGAVSIRLRYWSGLHPNNCFGCLIRLVTAKLFDMNTSLNFCEQIVENEQELWNIPCTVLRVGL